jgi:hypothetical protein
MTTLNNQDGRDLLIEPGEIEAADAAAQVEFNREGRLARTVITTKDFLADALPADLIAGVAKGTVVTLGTIAGEIYSAEKRQGEYQGKTLESIWLNGVFQAVVGSTGEVFTAGQAILPKSYGVQVLNAFKDLGVTAITLACTVGLRPSGRPIPYEWVVRDHVAHAAASRVAAVSDRLQALVGQTLFLSAGEGEGEPARRSRRIAK